MLFYVCVSVIVIAVCLVEMNAVVYGNVDDHGVVDLVVKASLTQKTGTRCAFIVRSQFQIWLIAFVAVILDFTVAYSPKAKPELKAKTFGIRCPRRVPLLFQWCLLASAAVVLHFTYFYRSKHITLKLKTNMVGTNCLTIHGFQLRCGFIAPVTVETASAL